MSAIKISAWLGLVLSVIGIFLKIARVLRQGEWWPFIAYDYLAAALLLIGAIAVLRGGVSGRWLAAGWGFGVAMFYGSFFDHLDNFMNHVGRDLAFERIMVFSTGAFLALNLLGLALALKQPARRPPH
jgi:hypothetical protein